MNLDNPLIDPNTIFQVALDFMNHDHQEAVSMVNQLNQAITVQDKPLIGELLQQFYQHNCQHFAHEEAEMERYSFPPYPVHKGEHQRVLAQMNEMLEHWQQNQDSQVLQQYLIQELIPWFEGHLQSMDFVTARYLSMQQDS